MEIYVMYDNSNRIGEMKRIAMNAANSFQMFILKP